MKRRVFALCLSFALLLGVCPVSVFAVTIVDSGTCGENLTWTLDDSGTLTISGTGEMANYYYDSFGNCSVPWYSKCQDIRSVVIGENVTSIGYFAFYGCENITSVVIPTGTVSIGGKAFAYCEELKSITIPNGVISIGSNAFLGCISLTSIYIPDSVTSIGSNAFLGCISLTSIYIPDSVTSIGGSAFHGCDNLSTIQVASGNQYYTSLNDVLLNKSKTTLIVAGKNITKFTVPNSVTSIAGSAFDGCSTLTNVIIPASVKSIGGSAFEGCSSLTSINIPDSVTSIGRSAFEGCSSLTSISIPNSVTSIYVWTFGLCTSLTSVSIPDSVTSISEFAFYGCTNLTNIAIPNSVTRVGGGAFADCTNLARISLPSNITRLEGEVFSGCANLTSIAIPNNVTIIENSAFSHCTSLTSIDIPNSVTRIGNSAFYYCTSLTSISIPSSVTKIEDYTFYACTSLTNIDIPNSVTSIGSEAFSGCTSLSRITIPESITKISNGTFSECRSLTSIVIPKGVTSIGYNAFYACTNLMSISIPYGVTTIESCTFQHCHNLTIISIPDSVARIEGQAFDTADSLEDVYYSGNKSQWQDIFKSDTDFIKATIHYNSDGSAIFPCKTYKNVKFKYKSSSGYEKTIDSVLFKDNWLFSDSYVYNHELATMALGFSMAGFEDDSKNYANSKKDSYIKDLYNSFDFATEGNAYKSVGYGKEDNDTIGMSITSKNLTNGAGDTVTLMVVTLRGAGYGDGGWAGDFEIGTRLYHTGFRKAAENARNEIRSYMKTNNISPGSVHILLTGYSRSAATANLLSVLLRADYLVKSKNIYTYTFATPSNQEIQQYTSGYDNIFNIVNPYDIIPMVPPKKWSYGKNGTTLYLPSTTSKRYSDFKSTFYSLTGRVYPNYSSLQLNIESILSVITDNFKDTNDYVSHLQSPLVKLKQGDQSSMNNIFGGHTTIEKIKNHIESEEYFQLAFELSKVIKYRKDMFGNQDPYLGVLDDLKQIAVSAYREVKDKDETPENVYTLLLLVDSISSQVSSVLFTQHWPEVYWSWMTVCDEDNLNETKTYRTAKVSCPVDVEVYDSENKLVGRTKTETFTAEDETFTVSVVDEEVTTLEATVIGDNKIFVLPDDQNYRMVIKTNETYQDGDTMSVYVTDYANGDAVGVTEYTDLSLTENAEFTGTVGGAEEENGLSACSLETEGMELEPTTTLYGEWGLVSDLYVQQEDGVYLISGIMEAQETETKVCCALYDENGRQIAVTVQTISAGDTDISLSLPAGGNPVTMKFFALDEMFSPLAEAIEMIL